MEDTYFTMKHWLKLQRLYNYKCLSKTMAIECLKYRQRSKQANKKLWAWSITSVIIVIRNCLVVIHVGADLAINRRGLISFETLIVTYDSTINKTINFLIWFKMIQVFTVRTNSFLFMLVWWHLFLLMELCTYVLLFAVFPLVNIIFSIQLWYYDCNVW